jgi:hypothetical protein
MSETAITVDWGVCCGHIIPMGDTGFVTFENVFQVLSVQTVPCKAPLSCCFAVRGTPHRPFKWRIDLVLPDGIRLSNPAGIRSGVLGRYGTGIIMYDASPFIIESLGVYRFEIFVDEELARTTLVEIAIDPKSTGTITEPAVH